MKCFKTSLTQDNSHRKTFPLLLFAALSLLAVLAGCDRAATPSFTTLTFSAIPAKALGNAPFMVSASSASSGAVTYSVISGPATINGATGLVTLTGTGTVQLSASQAATANYTSATATASFTVFAEFPTLTFAAIPTETFGIAPFTVSASSASSGAITYSVTSGPATIDSSTGLVTLTGAGTVNLSASQAVGGDFGPGTATASFTVNPETPALTFASIPTETYGNPAFTVSANSASSGTVTYSLTPGQTSSGTVTSAGVVTMTGVGTIYLTANQVASGNYAAATATTTVTVHFEESPSGSPILHVVVIMQENRTFDNLFNGFPGADSAQSGMSKGTVVPLSPIPLAGTASLDNSHLGWWRDWDNGKMDGFALSGLSDPLYTYSYVQSSDIQPYWTLATQYTLADRMFQSNTGPSFGAHLYMIAGQSGGADENPDNPSLFGCDAPAGTTVALIGPNGTDLPGVYPCFDYQTIADLLNAKGMTWRYYSYGTDTGFSAFNVIRHIFYAPDASNHLISPQTQVLTNIANGQLAQVTWITPDFTHSDHPGSNSNEGPDWVASIVNAIGASPYWDSTAIFINWDDYGGWYDHVVPPVIDNMGPGFRTPLIVVSPYAKRGYVSHQVYETASLLTFTEKNFDLPNLGTRDATANDLLDCFDYTQTVTPYAAIKTKVTADMLMREKPSGPPDDD